MPEEEKYSDITESVSAEARRTVNSSLLFFLFSFFFSFLGCGQILYRSFFVSRRVVSGGLLAGTEMPGGGGRGGKGVWGHS